MPFVDHKELARLHTQVRAANSLTAALRIAQLRAKKAQVFRDCVQSALDRYQFSIEMHPVRLARLRQQGIAAMVHDAIYNPPVGFKAVSQVHDEITFEKVPLGPMQEKCLRGEWKGGLDLAEKVEIASNLSAQRIDLHKEVAEKLLGRSAVADVASQVYHPVVHVPQDPDMPEVRASRAHKPSEYSTLTRRHRRSNTLLT